MIAAAVNSWLFAQTRRGATPYDKDKGYVCTLTAMVIKSATAHIFHIGDARVYRLSGSSLEQLTDDHRVVVSSQQSYLGRALGANPQVEIDYHAVPVAAGDVFVLATDGVYEYAPLRLPSNVDRLTAAAQLAIQAEFSGWELARVQLFRDGTRQVMLRRKVGGTPQPGLSY